MWYVFVDEVYGGSLLVGEGFVGYDVVKCLVVVNGIGYGFVDKVVWWDVLVDF